MRGEKKKLKESERGRGGNGCMGREGEKEKKRKRWILFHLSIIRPSGRVPLSLCPIWERSHLEVEVNIGGRHQAKKISLSTG